MAHTILLADDSVTIRKVVELTFSDTEIRVETAASGAEALERFEELHPDLVLADVIMPPPSGYDLCRAVKDSGHPVPVLLLAGTFEPFDEDQAHDCRADGHLVKPFESSYLVERVTTLLQRPERVDGAGAAGENLEAEEGEETEGLLDELLDSGVEQEVDPVDAPDVIPVESGEEGVEVEVRQVVGESGSAPAALDRDQLEALAEAVVARLSDSVVREIAWEVVPDLAETLIRERIRQLEKEDLQAGRS